MKKIIAKITAKFTAILKKTWQGFFLLPIAKVHGKKIFKQLGGWGGDGVSFCFYFSGMPSWFSSQAEGFLGSPTNYRTRGSAGSWGNPKAVSPSGDDDQPPTDERVFWRISKWCPDNMAIKSHKTFCESRAVQTCVMVQMTACSCIQPLCCPLHIHGMWMQHS